TEVGKAQGLGAAAAGAAIARCGPKLPSHPSERATATADIKSASRSFMLHLAFLEAPAGSSRGAVQPKVVAVETRAVAADFREWTSENLANPVPAVNAPESFGSARWKPRGRWTCRRRTRPARALRIAPSPQPTRRPTRRPTERSRPASNGRQRRGADRRRVRPELASTPTDLT